MKYIRLVLISVILLCPASSFAQYATIPDPNFRSWLINNGYSSCMNGSMLDTTCSLVTTATFIACNNSSINDISGIEYFDNLVTLYCHSNNLDSISKLPSSLKYLYANSNYIVSIPSDLPVSLLELVIYNNDLVSLPALPAGLEELNCTSNLLNVLPSISNSMEILDVGNNNLSSIPTLPQTLIRLYCSDNPLFSLPTLPNSLEELICEDNSLSSLPALPPNLNMLVCDGNQLSSLPTLPSTLTWLSCADNILTGLPALPNTLDLLQCYVNQITSLPTLPTSLKTLSVGFNQLTAIPELPDTMNQVNITGNQDITCLPRLGTIQSLYFGSTNITCLPNYGQVMVSNPAIGSLPLCDLFNTNGCDFYYNIAGHIFADVNSNCIDDTSENSNSGIKINLSQSGNIIQQIYSSQNGFYTFDTPLGTYDYFIDTSGVPFYVSCPPSGTHTSVLTLSDSVDIDMDFGIECKPGFDVGSLSIVSGLFFPGDTSFIKVIAGDISNFYNLNCAAGISGDITVTFAGPVQYAGIAPGALTPAVFGNTLVYTIADFGNVNSTSDFIFYLATDTTATANQNVCIDVIVNPITNDIDTTNNSLTQCHAVVNSFDPNDKTAYPDGDTHAGTEWINYTIRFQNTGTAPAQNILITDTLDNNLQELTFTYLGSSHDPFVQVIGNLVKFSFPNINLPDSTSDESNSHGYIHYKVKIDDNLPIGSIIKNSAAIYFDFNTPVITNTTLNTIVSPTGNFELQGKTTNVYPNPANNLITIESTNKIKVISIYDVSGRCIYDDVSNSKKSLVDISSISSGVYNLVVSDSEDIVFRRMLIISR